METATGQELELRQDAVPATPSNLFGHADPEQVVAQASVAATALARVIEEKKLFNKIGGRKHVNVEGWTLLGSMLGIFPVVEWSRPLPDDGGWEARVNVVTKAGELVGSAEAMCSRDENTWKNRDDYAIRSMAQTRAVSKALRHPLGFIVTLAGYDPTPEAEAPREQAPRTPTGPPMTTETRMKLLAVLPTCEGYDPERWNLDSVLASATRKWQRQINSLGDLREDEAQLVLAGAEQFIARVEQKAENYTVPEVEFEEVDPNA